MVMRSADKTLCKLYNLSWFGYVVLKFWRLMQQYGVCPSLLSAISITTSIRKLRYSQS